MKTIQIAGVIGLDTMAADIRQQFAEAKGEEIDLIINSPGGSVYEGIAIYNAIRDYRREGGTVRARVVGLAASMATYIPLAAETVAVEDNAVWMIHNPSLIAWGDHRAMRKAADILEGVTGILASGYERKTGKPREEIRAMMDDETYLYGEQITAAGFADEIVPAGDGAEGEEDAVALARMAVEGMTERLREAPEDEGRLAALLKVEAPKAEKEKPGVTGIKPAAKAESKQEGVVDIKTLEQEHPEVFAAVRDLGVKQERDRVAAFAKWKDGPAAREVADRAIAEGKSESDVLPQLIAAMNEARTENPPAVETNAPAMDGLTDEDRAAAKIMGMTLTEYAKYSKEA